MMHLLYSVTESIYRQYGQIIKLVYDYEENQEQVELDLLTQDQNHIPQYQHYRAIIKRDEYERIVHSYIPDKEILSFDNFVRILRPVMMGTYIGDELRDAFYLLDKDQSNTIDINELADFLSIIHSEVTKEILLNYVGKVDINTDQKLNFNEFTDIILRGIGKDIVCGHISMHNINNSNQLL